MDRGDLLIDPRFATTTKRMQNGEALYAEISNWDRRAHEVRGHGNDRGRRRALRGLSRHGRTAPRQAPDLARLRTSPGPARARRGAHARVRPPHVGVRGTHGPGRRDSANTPTRCSPRSWPLTTTRSRRCAPPASLEIPIGSREASTVRPTPSARQGDRPWRT